MKTQIGRTVSIAVLSVAVLCVVLASILVPNSVKVGLTARAGIDPGVTDSTLSPSVQTTGPTDPVGFILYGSIGAKDEVYVSDVQIAITSTTPGGPSAAFSLSGPSRYRVRLPLPEGSYTFAVALTANGHNQQTKAELAVTTSAAYEVSSMASASTPLLFFLPIPAY